MSALHKMIELAEQRSDGAQVTWQHLKQQCDEALMKLTLLKEHRERYRDMLRSGLERGMPALSTMAYLGFIGQIDEVVSRQEGEVGRIEAACARQWEELVERRREKRLYEIVGERAAARELAAAFRRSQAEIDDLLQRVVKDPMPPLP